MSKRNDVVMPKLFAVVIIAVLALGIYMYKKENILTDQKWLREAPTPGDQPLVVHADPGHVDFYSTNATVSILESFLHLTNDQLVYLDENFNLVPGLLESFSYDYSKDTYLLTLKENLTFSNGRQVTSEDLEFSIVRGFFSTTRNWWKAFLGNIEGSELIKPGSVYRSGAISGVKVIDDRSVLVKLAKPNPSFLHSLARSYFSIVPKEELESDFITWRKWPVGAGQYIVTKESETSTTLSPREQGKKLKIVFTKSLATPADVFLGQKPGIGEYSFVEQTRTTSIITILFNFDHPISSHPDFRKAIAFAANSKKLSSMIKNSRSTKYVIPSNVWGRIKLPDNYSIIVARRFLEQVKKDFKDDEATLSVLNGKIRVPVYKAWTEIDGEESYVQELQRSLQEIGLDVELYKSNKKSSELEFSNVLFRVTPLGADVVDPVVQYKIFERPSFLGPQAVSGDKSFSSLLEDAAKAKSVDTRSLAVKELTKYFHAKTLAVPIAELSGSVWASKKTVSSTGKQNGGLAVYLDRITKAGDADESPN